MLGQHAGEHLESKVIFVSQAVRLSLDDADFVVESFDESERHFVIDVTIADDSVPVTFDHAGESLVGFQPLPAERGLPSFVKSFGIDGGVVVPELSELFFEQVGFIESSIGLEE